MISYQNNLSATLIWKTSTKPFQKVFSKSQRSLDFVKYWKEKQFSGLYVNIRIHYKIVKDEKFQFISFL